MGLSVEDRDPVAPGQEAPSHWVQEVVKHGPLGGQLHGLHLLDPPLAELGPVVAQLRRQFVCLTPLHQHNEHDRYPSVKAV